MLEGEFDDVKITDQGRTLNGPSEFMATIAPGNQGILLRRRSDQALCGQRAFVHVDGKRVRERTWLYADANPNFRWLEDEFFVPASYTNGKKAVRIRIEPCPQNNRTNWNESFYWVLSVKVGSEWKHPDVHPPQKAVAPFDAEAVRTSDQSAVDGK